MQLRRLRYEGNYGIVGQVINVPYNVDEVAEQLPRHLDGDQASNVNLKKSVIFQLMLYYTEDVRTAVSNWPCYPSTSLLLTGDFNIEASNNHLKQFLDDKFRLVLATDPTDFTTFKNTMIDLKFSRDISVACKSYIAYYSYHCPVFNKILQISQHCKK
jgi:hypothetical protein